MTDEPGSGRRSQPSRSHGVEQVMFGVGFFEIIIIAVFALVFVGPKRLPEVMKQAGRLFVHLRRTANDVKATFEQAVRDAEDEIRREEHESLRQALQPIQDIQANIHQLLAAPNPEITDHPLDGVANTSMTPPAPQLPTRSESPHQQVTTTDPALPPNSAPPHGTMAFQPQSDIHLPTIAAAAPGAQKSVPEAPRDGAAKSPAVLGKDSRQSSEPPTEGHTHGDD